jgi:hypothetical protein
MEAQILTTSPVGEYYLTGVPETACGFKLSEDSTFQFFFSQGALDRFGEGKWKVVDDQLVLQSRKKPEHDFALVKSEKKAGNKIVVQMVEQNEMVKRYVFARITGGGKTQEAVADQDGMIEFTSQVVDTIELIFQFCPEKVSVFKFKPSADNYFEFRFEPWMVEFFFDGFKLKRDAEGMSGNNPVLPGGEFVYRKAGSK